MVDGEHNTLDFDFVVDTEVFFKAIPFCGYTYPLLTQFLSSESALHIKIVFSFASHQEAYSKDIKRFFMYCR
jgi:hypothetical protein